MSSRYTRIQTSESEEEADTKKIHAERVERIQTKIHAAIWVSLAMATIYYTDFIKVILTDERVNRTPLNLAIVSMVVIACILVYLCIYLPIFEKIKDYRMWDVHCPNMIPMLTGAGVCCIVSLVVARVVTSFPVSGFLPYDGVHVRCTFYPVVLERTRSVGSHLNY